MFPAPVAVSVTAMPLAAPPSTIAPPPAFAANDNAPSDIIEVVVEILLSLVTDSALKPAPEDERDSADPLLFTVADPVVFNARIGVTVVRVPKLPEPELTEIEVEPVSVPAAETNPVPLALNVSTVPLTADGTVNVPLFPVDNDTGPVEVIVPEVVNP